MSYEMCGGWNGSCCDYMDNLLEIVKYGEYEFFNVHKQYDKGYIKILEQNENTLRIRFEPDKHNYFLFSYHKDIEVTFKGVDTIVFHEECLDCFSYKFVRVEVRSQIF